MQQTNRYKGILNQISEAINRHKVNEIAPYRNFEEAEESDSEIEDFDLAELHDLSEYEDMISWDDLSDEDNIADGDKKFYNGTRDLDIADG